MNQTIGETEDHSAAVQPDTAFITKDLWHDSFYVVGSLSVVILLIVAYVRYFHKPRRERKHRHHHRPATSGSGSAASADSAQLAAASEPGVTRKRKRRREHRPRNPTLAETGGLPPVRPEGELPRGT